MNEMTLPSRHRIRNSSPSGLRPSTLLQVTEAPHNIESTSERRSIFFVSMKLEGQSKVRTRDLRLSKQAALTTAPGPRPQETGDVDVHIPANMRRWTNVGSTLVYCWTNVVGVG